MSVNKMSYVTHESLPDLQCCPRVNFTWHDSFYTCDVDFSTLDKRLIYTSVYIMRHVTCKSKQNWSAAPESFACGMTPFIHVTLTYLQVTHDSSIWVYTKYITSRANYCKCCLWDICMWHDSFYIFDVHTFTGDTRLIHMSVNIIHRVTHKSAQTWSTAPESLACHMTSFVHVMFTHLHVTHDSFIWVYT